MMPPMVMMVSVSATVSATPMLNDVTTSQLFTSFWTYKVRAGHKIDFYGAGLLCDVRKRTASHQN